MIWETIDINRDEVLDTAKRFSVDNLVSSILVRRDLNNLIDIKFFLEDDYRFLHNPFLFKDMEDVIDRIHSAVDEEEKVLIFGDKDVDGVTSTVILYESFKKLEIDVTWRVPKGVDGYGLSVSAVDKAYEDNISLIFTVDCGISAFDAISRARSLGIDVVIIDHHNQREGNLPDANYIINPKLDSSTYPFSGLAACGVVSKVLWALCFSYLDTLYKSSITFFHTEFKDDQILVSAIKIYNLLEVSRLSFVLDGDNSNDIGDLVAYLQGEQILVFDKVNQLNNFKEIFGTSVDLNVLDVKQEIERVLPGIRGHNLDNLLHHSRIKRYLDGEFNQIDLIKNLFLTYITKRYNDKFDIFFDSLDLVALGTVADLMPLKDENRILVKKGMKFLSSTKREGLHSLLLQQNILGKDISSKDISWNIAPILNSAGRMKKADVAVEFLLCEDVNLKNKLALDLLAINKERKSISESLWSTLYSEMHESYEELNKKLVLLYNNEMEKGVTGIIASRILSTFSVPGIVLAKEGEYLTGSIRSSGNLDIPTLCNKLGDILIDWGGHKCAAGFKFRYSDLNTFKKRVTKLVLGDKVIDKSKTVKEGLKIDANIPKGYMNPDIIKVCDMFEPFGEGNKPLNFATTDAKIIDINFMGKVEKKHLRMLIEIDLMKWPAIFWNGAELVGKDFTKGDTVSLLYRVERNFYGGNETLQLNILDIIK